jgi:antitoxin component of RelBE/YafQ-DinJ toxin-antitoxin module
MKSKAIKEYSAKELDRMALDMSDVKPMPAAMRRKWEAAQQTGKRMNQRTSAGRPQKASTATSRIVPVSLDSTLLSEADRYAKSAGISRSRLVAEALRLRMNQTAG